MAGRTLPGTGLTLLALLAVGCGGGSGGGSGGGGTPTPSAGDSSIRSVTAIAPLASPGGRLDWLGDRIAFDRRGDDGYFDVWTMASDGTGAVDLTAGFPGLPTRHVGNPAWHPSGAYLVVQAQKQSSPTSVDSVATPGQGVLNDLWLIAVDRSACWRLRNLSPTVDANAQATLHPSFSHDGTQLFWSERTGDNGRPFGAWRLMIADFAFTAGTPALSNIRSFTPGTISSFYESHGFSPDDRRVLFTSNLDGAGLDIYGMAVDGSDLVRLTDSSAWDEHAHYSPDGRTIVWMSSEGLTLDPDRLTTEYWAMDPDGRNKRQLTWFNTPGHVDYQGRPFVTAADSAFSPDGTRLAALLLDSPPTGPGVDTGYDLMLTLSTQAMPSAAN